MIDVFKLLEYLDVELKEYFVNLCECLDVVGVEYMVNEKLVCGLDYYNCIVFEWVIDSLGV